MAAGYKYNYKKQSWILAQKHCRNDKVFGPSRVEPCNVSLVWVKRHDFSGAGQKKESFTAP